MISTVEINKAGEKGIGSSKVGSELDCYCDV